VDEEPLAQLEAHLGEESVMGSDEDFGDSRCFLERKKRGDRQCLALLDDDVFGIAATTNKSHDPIARLPQLDSLAHRLHLTGVLEARDLRRPARWRRVQAAPLQQVGPVDPGGADPDPDLPSTGFPRPNLLHFKHFRASGLPNHDRAHLGHGPPPDRLAPPRPGRPAR
jgi:hypothetical protein